MFVRTSLTVLLGSLFVFVFAPKISLAANYRCPQGVTNVFCTNITDIQDVADLISDVTGAIQVFLFILATLFIILAAFNYLTAGGDEEKIKKGKQMLIYALVAIVIAAIAFGAVKIVLNFIPGTGGGAF